MKSIEARPLTKREKEILKELMSGGRISSIAIKLGLSPHTVKNHLRRIFAKTKVHSQTKLIEYVAANPIIMMEGRNSSVSLSTEFDNLQDQTDAITGSDTNLQQRIGIVLREQLASTLKRLVRLILPLDQERKQAWQSHLINLPQHSSEPNQLSGDHAKQEAYYRGILQNCLNNLMDSGLLQTDLNTEEISRGLSITITGTALELMRNPARSQKSGQLQDLDTYIDKLLNRLLKSNIE